MRKNTVAVLQAVLIGFSSLHATMQVNDLLYFENKTLGLRCGWGHPSPLETYFIQNNMKSPFTWVSTANYRGFVAVWEIKDNTLYLNYIKVRDKKYKAEDFDIRSKYRGLTSQHAVFADWFTGILDCTRDQYYYYFHIKKGKVVDYDVYELSELSKINAKDEPERYKLLRLNDNYITYYYRLSIPDFISYNNTQGHFYGHSAASPLLQYYNNDHMKWPYNWENLEKSGAPHCKWIIKDQKLYLTHISILSGTSFSSVDITKVSFKEIFKQKKKQEKAVFAKWVSGIFMIKHGQIDEENINKYYNVKAESYSYMRIKKGIIEEIYTVKERIDKDNMPEDIDGGLKKLLEELQY